MRPFQKTTGQSHEPAPMPEIRPLKRPCPAAARIAAATVHARIRGRNRPPYTADEHNRALDRILVDLENLDNASGGGAAGGFGESIEPKLRLARSDEDVRLVRTHVASAFGGMPRLGIA